MKLKSRKKQIKQQVERFSTRTRIPFSNSNNLILYTNNEKKKTRKQILIKTNQSEAQKS